MSAEAGRHWYSVSDECIRFDVRLTPAAGGNGFVGLAEDAAGRVHLKARVTAVAEKNKANEALVVLIAKSLRVAKGDVRIVAGATSRMKSVEISCPDTPVEPLAERLGALAQ